MRVLLIIIVAMIATGCGPAKVHHNPPEIVGERTNSSGEVVQQMILEMSYTTRDFFFTPEGPHNNVKYQPVYFLQDKDKPKLELSAVRTDEFRYCSQFHAVDSSPLWVGIGLGPLQNANPGHPWMINGVSQTSHNENDLHIVVFDEKHLISHKKFSVIPKFETDEDEFKFDNGNGTIILHSTTGLKKYDVLTDSVSDADQNSNSPKR